MTCRPILMSALKDVTRSLRTDVRNPLLALPSMQAILALDPASRAAMRGLLREIAVDARGRAEKCWRTHKAPMAAYWKAVAVYAGHTARALKAPQPDASAAHE